jgi:hypothetical protein
MRGRRVLIDPDDLDQDVSIDSLPKTRRRRSVRVKVDLVYGAVDRGQDLHYTVLNQTDRPILAAAHYEFERRASLIWRSQPITEGRVASGGPVEAGKRSREMWAHVPNDFPAGRYRLTTYLTPLDQNGLPIRRGVWPVHIKLVSKAFSIKHAAR